MNSFSILISVGLLLGVCHGSFLNVDVDQPGHRISPTLWGIFFEEINHAGEGGLYAELIKNRALSPKLQSAKLDGIFHGWGVNLDGYDVVKSEGADGRIYISREHPFNDVLTTSLLLNVYNDVAAWERIGVSNEGHYGIPIRPDYTTYRASFYAKSLGSFRGPLTVSIESKDGSVVFATAQVPQITDQFQKYEVTLTPNQDLIRIPSLDNLFTITASGVPNGTSLFFNVISLFPPTFKNRENGLRIDLAQKLEAAKPSFFRFPGGNYLEGNSLADRFIWEETIGDISRRPGHMGCWNYYSTDGLGLLEYLQLAEDLNAEIVLGVFAGYALNGDSVPPQEMQPYIDSALNEIEYVIGDTSTYWGARRAADGHPEPFPLTYIEIGNEDWFSTDYYIRYPIFYDAIRAKYPHLQLISTQGDITTRPIHIRDDHHYPGYGWFPDNHRWYDNAPRDGPKIFIGEYATMDNFHPSPEANVAAAIDDAAFMTGLERNSDIVIMACYAPLFGHLNDLVWRPDGIYYDVVQSYATPAWWVQTLFGSNQGDTYIPTFSDANEGRPTEKIFHVASKKTDTNTLILKIVNTNTEDIAIDTVQLNGVSGTRGGSITVLTGGQWDENDLAEPLRVSPTVQSFDVTSNSFAYNAPAFSLTILELQL